MKSPGKSKHTRFRISSKGFEELLPLPEFAMRRRKRLIDLSAAVVKVKARIKEIDVERAELVHFLKLAPRFRPGGKWSKK